MIYNGKCPYCGGELVEARTRRWRNQDVLDESGPFVKTKCSYCNRFIGLRPADLRARRSKQQKALIGQ
jgi:hypothetical protein